MTKTIKEMSDERFPESYGRDSEGFYSDANQDMRYAYNEGANAVLEEIAKFADSTWTPTSLNTISLKKRIKELKG